MDSTPSLRGVGAAHDEAISFTETSFCRSTQDSNTANSLQSFNGDFEAIVAEVKGILAALNKGDTTLKDSVMLYKQGILRLKTAQDMLNAAKLEFEEFSDLHTLP